MVHGEGECDLSLRLATARHDFVHLVVLQIARGITFGGNAVRFTAFETQGNNWSANCRMLAR
jgi:hypothetical protein